MAFRRCSLLLLAAISAVSLAREAKEDVLVFFSDERAAMLPWPNVHDDDDFEERFEAFLAQPHIADTLLVAEGEHEEKRSKSRLSSSPEAEDAPHDAPMEASAGKLAGRSHISRVWQILYDASAFCTHLGDFTMPYHSGGLTVLLDAGSIEQKPAVYVSEFRKAHRVAISRREATETYNRALIEITIRGERGPLEREDTWTDDDYACCREYATFVFWLYTDQPKYLVGPQIVKPYCWPDVDADASPTCKHSPPGPHSCIIRTNHFVASTD